MKFVSHYPFARIVTALYLLAAVSAPSVSVAIAQQAESPIHIVGGEMHADLFTGTATTSIPIDVPPGRNGMQSILQLVYSSTNGNGWVGMGWKLEVGAIERQTRFGVNYGANDYTIRLNGVSMDLIQAPPPAPSDEYRAKIESEFLRIKKLAGGWWEVTDKKGIKYLFGQTAASRIADPADSNKVFKWCLDWVVDRDGNYMKVTYWGDTANNQGYLDEVRYTGYTTNGLESGSTIAPTNIIKFWRESRSDAPPMYTSNFLIKTAYRLKTIEVKANTTTLVRAYKLTYTTNSNTSNSVLATVQQFGKDATVNQSDGTITPGPGPSLPAINLTWTQGNAGWTGAGTIADLSPAQGFTQGNTITVLLADAYPRKLTQRPEVASILLPPNPTSYPVVLGDWNGDGKTDVGRVSGTGVSFYVSNGNGTWSSGGNISGNLSPGQGYTNDNTYPMVLGDWNGDGKTDLGRVGTNGVSFYISDGTGGWTTFGSGLAGFSPAQGFSDASTYPIVIGDWNGDGKTDVGRVGTTGVSFYISDGTGGWTAFGSGLAGFSPGQGYSDFNTYPIFTDDWNGDGKSDLGRVGTNGVSFYISDGAGGWTAFGSGLADFSPAQGFSNGNTYPIVTGDWNGDGKKDIGRVTPSAVNFYWSDGNGGWTAGPGSIADLSPGQGFTDAYSRPLMIGDWNGDGKTDVGRVSGTGVSFYKEASPFHDLLASFSNGLGGTTTLTYTSSTQYTNTLLPFPVQTVSAITTDDGNGNVATTSYTYSGGFHHIAERDFRGFNKATVTGPLGPNGEQAITETWFHQGNDVAVDANNPNVATGYAKGLVYRTKVTNAAAQVLTETTTSYAADADTAAPWFTPPLQVDNSIESGAKQTRIVYTYDHTYGNVTREDQHGDLSTTADDRTVVRAFGLNTADWIVGLPTSETIYQGIGTSPQVAKTDFYYDGTTSCSTASTNQVPTLGHLTRVVRWLNGGTSPATRMAYDAYGNRTCTRDPRGNTTTIAYDTGTNTFPLTVTNPLSHVTTTAYYGVNGVVMDLGLYGQVKSVTDPNNQVVTTKYDTLGRKTEVIQPTATGTFTSTIAYVNFGQGIGTDPATKQHVYTTNGLSLSSWTFFDGLGRPISKHRTGPGGGAGPNIVADTLYDARGALWKRSVPYFLGSPPPEANKWTVHTYDPLGRVLQITNPDTTTMKSCYSNWVTVTIDTNNHRKRQTKDAAGRLIAVEEYTGTFPTCDTGVGTPYASTVYQYDVLGNLTKVTDAKSNQTTMRYDTLSRKIGMADPDMGRCGDLTTLAPSGTYPWYPVPCWNYEYDAGGNLIRQTDAKGQVLWFRYDALNRRRQKDYTTQKPLGSGDVVYTYDGTTYNRKGRLQKVQDASGTIFFRYDPMGRITRTDKTLDSTTYITESTYDGVGRVTSVKYPTTPAKTVEYFYTGPWLEKIKDKPTDGTTTYVLYAGYNALGQPATATFGNGVVTTYSYQSNTFRIGSISTVNALSSGYGVTAYGGGYGS